LKNGDVKMGMFDLSNKAIIVTGKVNMGKQEAI